MSQRTRQKSKGKDMSDYTNSRYLGEPRATIEEAQADHTPTGFFDPAAVFESEGQYFIARIRDDNWPPTKTAEHMKTWGLNMVACCDSLLGIWKTYPFPEKAAQ